MESKRVVMCVTVLIVMIMGNLLIQTEAQASPSPLLACIPTCLSCPFQSGFPDLLLCPLKCLMKCLNPSGASLTDVNNHNDYYCKLGCSVHHCAPLYTPTTKDKVVDCVGTCSDKCSA